MLIGEVAKRTGLPIHTIRFYEKAGLIDERFFERGANNYRYYTAAIVERVQMIQQGQAAGYMLSEIRALIAAWDAGELTSEAQVRYMQQKIVEISQRIAELEQIRTYLMDKVQRMQVEA